MYTQLHIYIFLLYLNFHLIRDRPFNLKGGGGYGFLFRSEFFFRTTLELEYLFFLSRKVQFFLPEFNIRLYDKNSESDYFFFLHQNFFQQHWESVYFFLEKNHNPPLQVKWSFPNDHTWHLFPFHLLNSSSRKSKCEI